MSSSGTVTDDRPGRPGPRRFVPSALLAAALTSACWLEDCTGLDECDPTKQDCSLSVTCCAPVTTPSAPFALTCERHASTRAGDAFAEFALHIRGGVPPYAYNATFGDGRIAVGNRTGTAGADNIVVLEHTYDRPAGLEPRTFNMAATVTDQANGVQICTVDHPVDPATLDLDCNVSPRHGFVPLSVSFEARPMGCIGPCQVTWDFGDGVTAPSRFAQHTYAEPGNNPFYTWPARGRVTDSTGRSYECLRTVEVRPVDTPPSPPPTGPSPPPYGNIPPVITGFTANPTVVYSGLSAVLSATITDADGDPVSWTLSVDGSSTSTGVFTPSSGVGNLSSLFARGPGAPAGTVVIRVVASDGRGGTAQATVTVTIITG